MKLPWILLCASAASLSLQTQAQQEVKVDFDLVSEYETAQFVAKELQLIYKLKCKTKINAIELIKNDSNFKKLISAKFMDVNDDDYDKLLFDMTCPVKKG